MKLIYSIYKEYKVLIRDRAGLAIMFIMPTALILILTLVQDSTFRSVNESAVPLLLVDRDHDSIGQVLGRALSQSRAFNITQKQMSDEETKTEVAKGHYLIGIVIPAQTSEQLRERSGSRIETMMQGFAGDSAAAAVPDTSKLNLLLYFDPITKTSFKSTISNALERIISQIELQSMMGALSSKMKASFPNAKAPAMKLEPIVTTKESYASFNQSTIIPNSVQHNVPAWTMFAMFFICIPLAGNIIREREDGSAFRLLTMPGSYFTVMLGKMLTYLIVSLLQFALMLCVGLYVLPAMGLPQLNTGGHLLTLIVVAISSGLAATAFGLLVGTVSTSHDQASLFGALFVIILAAIGGVWIPTFVMPDIMRKLSGFSPLNWGLEAFYGVFLRNLGVKDLLPEIAKLLGFFVACTAGAFYYQRYKRLK